MSFTPSPKEQETRLIKKCMTYSSLLNQEYHSYGVGIFCKIKTLVKFF